MRLTRIVLYRRASSQSGLDARPRIEIITQRVANKVEREYGEHYRQRRKKHKMRRIEQMRAPIVEHGPPARGRRRYAKSEKAHGGIRENRPGHADRSLHHDGLNNVGQNVAGNNS